MPKYFIRHYRNETLAKAIIHTLYDNGHRWGDPDWTKDSTLLTGSITYEGYYFNTENKDAIISCSSYAYYIREQANEYQELTIDKFFALFTKPTTILVKLNAKYTAEVTKDRITVGCQTFPHSIVADLAKAQKALEI
jgi:hypothetical protein